MNRILNNLQHICIIKILNIKVNNLSLVTFFKDLEIGCFCLLIFYQ